MKLFSRSRQMLNRGCVAALATATILLPGALRAERINPETDLLAGDVPSKTLGVDTANSSITGQYSGSANNLTTTNDGSFGLFYLSKVNTDGCGADFTLTTEEYFNTYAIRVAKSNSNMTVKRAPKMWKVWGKTADEGAEWVLLDIESDQTDWQFADNGGLDGGTVGAVASPGETRYYHFTNGGVKYKYIRFRFFEGNGDGSYMAVMRIALYRPATRTTGATAETFASCSDLVPASTSATQSRYTSTTHPENGSTYFTLGTLWAAFSNDDPARVIMKKVDTGIANLIYEFGTDDKKIVNGYMFRETEHQYTDLGLMPLTWTFSGSDDKSSWTTLDTRTDQFDWSKSEKRYYIFDNHTAYAYYKIEFLANNGAEKSDRYYEFGNLDYYYLPQTGVFFTGLDTSFADGTLTVSGAVATDSLAADVSFEIVTNGVRFIQSCGTKQPGEAFSVSFPVTPGVLYGTLTGISGTYTNRVAQSPVYIPGEAAALFVSPTGSDTDVGTSLEAPKRHIAAAVEALGASGGMVYVLPGEYAETNDLSAVELTNAVSVIGVTGDPADVIVTRSAKYARIFKLANSSALVRSLTMQGGNVQNEPKAGHTAAEANSSASSADGVAANGGNLWITEAGGVVENCVIRDGKASRWAVAGGNVYMKGGRLSRCVLTGGDLSNAHGIDSECGTSLLADGNSLVENCLFTGTTKHRVPVCVGGSAKMLNCTVVGNSGTNCGGILIKGDNSRVVNTVIYGNTTTNTVTEAHSAVYLASKKTRPSDGFASTTFVNCASDGETSINGSCILVGASAFADAANGNYAPASQESALVNKGADYAANGGVSAIDLAGNPRVWTSKPDIGAFEFQYVRKNGTVVYFR